jgi:hypothetical protein
MGNLEDMSVNVCDPNNLSVPVWMFVGLCRDVFKAGASLYGVADIELLAKHTHKFESR